jgi:hypothetical protein
VNAQHGRTQNERGDGVIDMQTPEIELCCVALLAHIRRYVARSGAAMERNETKLQMAQRHVRQGAAAISRQRALADRLTAKGNRLAMSAKELLYLFEENQHIFEDDLARLESANSHG